MTVNEKERGPLKSHLRLICGVAVWAKMIREFLSVKYLVDRGCLTLAPWFIVGIPLFLWIQVLQ